MQVTQHQSAVQTRITTADNATALASLKRLIKARSGSCQIGDLTALMTKRRPQGAWAGFNPEQMLSDRVSRSEMATRYRTDAITGLHLSRLSFVEDMVKHHPSLSFAAQLMQLQQEIGVPEMAWSSMSLPLAAFHVPINRETQESMYAVLVPTEIVSLSRKVIDIVERQDRGIYGGAEGIYITSRAGDASIRRHNATTDMVVYGGTCRVTIGETEVRFGYEVARSIKALKSALETLPGLLPDTCGDVSDLRLNAAETKLLPYPRFCGRLASGKVLLVMPAGVKAAISAMRMNQA